MGYSTIRCPKCLSEFRLWNEERSVLCYKCKKRILDISYSSPLSSPISNLFPHKFVLDGVKCLSMESFIQSLRVEDEITQQYICENYYGYMAYKMRLALNDWRKEGFVWWKSKKILRESDEYEELMTRAYDALFENIVFRHCLNSFKEDILIHSEGNYIERETLLTESEYISQLNRLIEKL